MGLSGHDLESCVRDRLRDGVAETGRQDGVELPGEDERGRGDLRQAVGRVVREAGVELCLEALYGLLVGKASASSTIWSTVPSACARGV